MTSRRPHRQLPARAVVVLLVAIAAAGCAAVPTTSTPNVGSAQQTEGAVPFVRVIARPPQPGASPTEVVSGFLDASAAFEDNWAIARTYLAFNVAKEWQPNTGVSVYDAGTSFALTQETSEDHSVVSIVMRAPNVASISSTGSYRPAPIGAQTSVVFPMRRVDGQWRIAAAPTGLLLSTFDATRNFQAFNVYFVDNAQSVLVPDPVFLPTQNPDLAGALVRSLLRGPSLALAPAVSTGIPSGTELATSSVPIVDGIAQVALTAQARTATPAERTALAAQLSWTLEQIADVSGVQVDVDGQPLDIPDQQQPLNREAFASYNPDAAASSASAFALQRGRLVAVSDQGTTSYFPGPAGTGKLHLVQPAVEPNLNPAAAMLAGIVSTVGRQTLYAGTAASPHPVFVGTSLVAPSWDRNGDVWTVQRTGPQAGVYLSHATAHATRVGLVGAAPSEIEGIRLAPDGVRVALIVHDAATGVSKVELGLVVRSHGTVRISGLHRFETRLVQAQSVAWATDTQLAILGGDAQSALQTYLIAIDGSAITVLGGVPGISSIAATAQHPTLAGTSTGVVWADSGSGWRKVVAATWPGYPG